MLTGIFNRREIMHYIENEARRVYRRYQQDNASVLNLKMGDIDKLKAINDTYGHQATKI
jgi:diguanylate cyclase (GGDEF)-like protein